MDDDRGLEAIRRLGAELATKEDLRQLERALIRWLVILHIVLLLALSALTCFFFRL